jgi:hypothetical protein
MRFLRLLLTAALLAGTVPADAQVRALRPAGGGSAAAPVRLSVPSAGVVPSRAVPSLAPALPALNDAPKPGAVLRAEAAETVAQWRAARAAAPAPLVAPEASAPKAVLTAEQTAAAATDAIIAAKGVDEALGSLVSLGVLKAEALPEGPTDRLALLKRVWDGVSSKRAAELLPVDSGWAVPALRVQRGGKTYLVHGVAHGQYYPAHRGTVMRLVKQVSAEGSVLLSEQRIPEHYGFSYGLETLDHAVVAHDERAEVVKAARGLPPAAIGAVHALMRLGALGGVGYAWARAALQGVDPLAWGLALAGTAVLYLLWRGMQPLNRLSVLAGAREADALGSPQLAEQLRREAQAFFTKPVKAEDVRALHLPPGPAAASNEFSPRSAAIAAAAQAAEGAVVHVLVGYKHAAEIAWRLAGYPAGAGAASKDEDGGNGGRINKLSGIAIGAMLVGGAAILAGSFLGVNLVTGAGAALLAASVLAWAMPRHFSRVPFGGYRAGYWQGRPARYYGWSLSPNSFFQSAVLGALGGPIVFGLMGGSLLWSIGGMALAPLVVDLLKPTILYESTPGGRNGGAVESLASRLAALAGAKPKLPRDLTMTEVFLLNLAGMAAAVGIGMLLKSWIVGLIGLYIVPVPFIVGYVLLRRLMGDLVKMPLIKYDPGISWAGKRYPYGDDDKGARNGGRITQVGFFAGLGLVSLLLGLGLQDGWFLLGGGIWLGTALLGLILNRRR